MLLRLRPVHVQPTLGVIELWSSRTTSRLYPAQAPLLHPLGRVPSIAAVGRTAGGSRWRTSRPSPPTWFLGCLETHASPTERLPPYASKVAARRSLPLGLCLVDDGDRQFLPSSIALERKHERFPDCCASEAYEETDSDLCRPLTVVPTAIGRVGVAGVDTRRLQILNQVNGGLVIDPETGIPRLHGQQVISSPWSAV